MFYFLSYGKSAMLMGCGYNDELKYRSRYIGHYGYVGSGLYPFKLP